MSSYSLGAMKLYLQCVTTRRSPRRTTSTFRSGSSLHSLTCARSLYPNVSALSYILHYSHSTSTHPKISSPTSLTITPTHLTILATLIHITLSPAPTLRSYTMPFTTSSSSSTNASNGISGATTAVTSTVGAGVGGVLGTAGGVVGALGRGLGEVCDFVM